MLTTETGDLMPGDVVLFQARDLRDGERPCELEGVVTSTKGEHVWLRVGGAGRMCIARRAILLVCRRGAA